MVAVRAGGVRGRWGFTMVETLLALVIVLMVVTLAVPSMLAITGDAAVERAKAEIAGALSDARSLARARGMPVVVSVLPGGLEESEIVGVVVAAAADGDGAAADEEGDAADGAALGEEDEGAAGTGEALEGMGEVLDGMGGNPAVGSARRRLGMLPVGCVIGVETGESAGLDAGTGSAVAETTGAGALKKDAGRIGRSVGAGMGVLAVVFPDGTAATPRRGLVMTIPAGRGATRVFEVRVSSWFAEASFRERVAAGAAGEGESGSEAGETGTDEGVGGAEEGESESKESGMSGATGVGGR